MKKKTYLRERERQLETVRVLRREMIVCGDCMGDDLLPRKTHLTDSGVCAQCGGRSYVLASLLCARLGGELMLARLKEKLRLLKEGDQPESPMIH